MDPLQALTVLWRTGLSPLLPIYCHFSPVMRVLLRGWWQADAHAVMKGAFVCDWPVRAMLDLHSCWITSEKFVTASQKQGCRWEFNKYKGSLVSGRQAALFPRSLQGHVLVWSTWIEDLCWYFGGSTNGHLVLFHIFIFMERWAEFWGCSEGIVHCWPWFFSSY